MTPLLKSFLRVTANMLLIGGLFLPPVMFFAGVLGMVKGDGDVSWASASNGIGVVLFIFFCGLVVGGLLRLLLSIDDRLERLEGKS